MCGLSLLDRMFIALCLLAGAALFAPAVLAQDETVEDFAAPSSNQAAPVPVVPASPSPSSPSVGSADKWLQGAAYSPPAAAPFAPSGASRPAAVATSAARTGPPPEAGLPGWMSAPPPPTVSGLDWHGNLELDDGYVKYSWNTGDPPEKVYDSRGRFVLGPMLTQDLGNGYFLRETGQVVAWVREDLNYYQINADDVYVQVGQQGRWDFMAGRFLTWRVFRKGLGFDLYTLEDTGARIKPNFSDQSQWFTHMYEVNTIFMRDGGTPEVPSGRAAFHLYPTPWSGIELVGSYGRLQSGGNVLGGRLAGGIKPRYFSLLVGAEYETWLPAQQQFQVDQATLVKSPCDKCGQEKKYGAGGSLAATPLQQIEIAFSLAYGKHDIAEDITTYAHRYDKTFSWGGYLQLDAGSLVMHRSLIAGGAFFRTEYRNEDDLYHRHDQLAAYLAYPLGFNNAVVKLVFSKATGHQEHRQDPIVDGDMYSLRLRFAYYY